VPVDKLAGVLVGAAGKYGLRTLAAPDAQLDQHALPATVGPAPWIMKLQDRAVYLAGKPGFVEPMRGAAGCAAEHCSRSWQCYWCQCNGFTAIQVDIGQALRRRAEDDADIGRRAVEEIRDIAVIDDAQLPRVINGPLRPIRDRDRIPAAGNIGFGRI